MGGVEERTTGRLAAFTDGVFAIAITLLVLTIRIPEPQEDLGQVLVRQWPAFVAYTISFLAIGVMWVSHHQMFTVIVRTTTTFLFLNILFLLPIAFFPYPTALVATYLLEPSGRTLAVLVYGATSVAIAVMFNVLWGYASRRGLLIPRARPNGLRTRGFSLGPVVYLAGTLAAIVNPFVALAIFAAVTVYWMLPGRLPGR